VWGRRGEWRIMEDRRGKVRKQMDVPLQRVRGKRMKRGE
jgi:hypothetical protein